MKRFVYFVMVIVLLMSSCTPATEISAPTNPAIPLSTSTNTSLPTPTGTLVMPTATIIVSLTPSNTSIPYPPTLYPFLTAQVSWKVCDGAEEPDYEYDLSPDGNWLAVNCQPNDSSELIGTRIVRLNGVTTWDVSFYENYGIYQKDLSSPEGIRLGEMRVLHWLSDGSYVYLIPYFCCVDSPEDVFFNYFLTAPALYRLDLKTGKITTTLPPFSWGILPGYNVSFSPTDKYLAYVVSNDPRVVNIYDLQSGEIFTITLDEQYVASGNFTWSEDGYQIIFNAVKYGWHNWENPVKDGVSYFLLNVKERSSLHLFDQDDFYPVNWTDDGNIMLHRIYDGETLLYNLKRNKFTHTTPTPHP